MSSRVIVALRVKANPQRAFEVFTRDIGLWWQQLLDACGAHLAHRFFR